MEALTNNLEQSNGKITQILDNAATLTGNLSKMDLNKTLNKVDGTLSKVDGTLSSLKRLNEGAFFYDNEKALNPLEFLKIPQNIYTGDPKFLELGKKLYIDYFETKEDGEYWVETETFFSVIEILDGDIKYKLNRVHKYVG